MKQKHNVWLITGGVETNDYKERLFQLPDQVGIIIDYIKANEVTDIEVHSIPEGK